MLKESWRYHHFDIFLSSDTSLDITLWTFVVVTLLIDHDHTC